jgi:hypothetical protein
MANIKIGDRFRTIDCEDSLFLKNSIVEVIKIGKIRIRYKYIRQEVGTFEHATDYSQSKQDFKNCTVMLTELDKALL